MNWLDATNTTSTDDEPGRNGLDNFSQPATTRFVARQVQERIKAHILSSVTGLIRAW